MAVQRDLDDGVASGLVQPGVLVLSVHVDAASSLLAVVVAVSRPSPSTTLQLPSTLDRAHPLMTAMSTPRTRTPRTRCTRCFCYRTCGQLRKVLFLLGEEASPSIGNTLWRVSTMFTRSAITPPEVNGFG